MIAVFAGPSRRGGGARDAGVQRRHRDLQELRRSGQEHRVDLSRLGSGYDVLFNTQSQLFDALNQSNKRPIIAVQNRTPALYSAKLVLR